MVAARLSFSAGTLVLERASSEQVQSLFPSGPWVWDSRSSVWRCDAMNYASVRQRMETAGWTIESSVRDWQAVHWNKVSLPVLREEQQQAADAWSQDKRGIIVMPTGTGKTEVALEIMRRTAVSTLVISPVRDLMYQWHRRIQQGLGYDSGIIGDNVYQLRPISVTTFDSACIHMERFGNHFALIVFDECHHLPGTIRRDAARMSAAPWRLGLTATPIRGDGRHVDNYELIGPLVYELALEKVRGRILADYEVIRIPVHLEESEQARYDLLSKQLQTYFRDRREKDPQFRWDNLFSECGKDPEARRALDHFRQKQAIEDRAVEKLRILEDLFRLHVGTPIVIFAGSNAMARDVARRFLIPCLLSHCGKKERMDVLSGLQDGTYPALVCNQVLDEGVDLPSVKVAVVIGGLASSKQAQQRLGRILRKSGNQRATLYEVVCADTKEEARSRKRRASAAYEGTIHRRRRT